MLATGNALEIMENKDPDAVSSNQDPNQPRPSTKRKRGESPSINGRSPRQLVTSDQNPRHAKDTSPNMQRPYFPQSNGNDLASIQQQISRHVANADASPTTAAAALAASMPQLNVPQPTELSFPSTNSGNEDERPIDSSFDMGPDIGHQQSEGAPYHLNVYPSANGDQTQGSGANNAVKPAVGTDEWHKVRKDNHKEVERRRRETINEGINELAKIVPGCDKNKGAILQRGVQYISQLKENESRNIEKWTLEKMLTDQAIQELTTSVDKLKDELARSRRDAEHWKAQCEAAGLSTSANDSTSTNSRNR